MDIGDFEHVWGNPDAYSIVRLRSGREIIIKSATRSALVIENEDAQAEVIRRLRAGGAKTLDGLPKD
jgi:hypothetical protein